MPGGPPGIGGFRQAGGITFLNLKHANAEVMAAVLKKLFPNVDMTADPRTNTLIVRADDKTLEELKGVLSKLDVQVGRPK
jgi:type II secretory pathway component GspD/PulD (secretin)